MDYFIITIFAILGLFIGSFLNVVILRLHSKEPIAGKGHNRSHCPKCEKTLEWYELIPVLSFILQKGKCRGCNDKISIQYILVEAVTAVVFGFIAWWTVLGAGQQVCDTVFSCAVLVLFYLIIFSGLIVIFVYDLKYFLIPDKVLFPIMVVAFGYVLYKTFLLETFEFGLSAPLAGNLLTGFLFALLFFAVFFVSQGKWMGFGDVKYAFFMGLLTGFPAILPAAFISFLLGAIIGLGLILTGFKGLSSKIPFAPFLIIGTFMGVFWGRQFADWYFNLFII